MLHLPTPRIFRASKPTARIISLALCGVLILTTTPQAQQQSLTITESKPDQSRQLPPYTDLPDINALVDEGKNPKPAKPQPALKPSTLCGWPDKACRAKKEKEKKEKKASLHTAPSGKPSVQSAALVTQARQNKRNWLSRFGRAVSDKLGSLTAGLTSASAKGHSFSAGNAVAASPAAVATLPAPPPPPPTFNSVEEAKLDPRYRTGGGGEDLFSGNYHWSLPLVSLPGRNGHDLNLTLSYNSLVWLRYGNTMQWEPDY